MRFFGRILGWFLLAVAVLARTLLRGLIAIVRRLLPSPARAR